MITFHQQRKKEAADPNKPTLHQAPGSHERIEDGQPSNDDRPVLKRRLADADL
jgi:hypothetical protein